MQVLYTMAALGVADEIGRKGPQTAQELAYSLGMHSFSCTRPLQFSLQLCSYLGVIYSTISVIELLASAPMADASEIQQL